MQISQKNLQKPKKVEHIPCGYSMSTIRRFDLIENKHTFYRGKYYMKIFCHCLREHAKNIIEFKKKKLLSLTQEELKLYQYVELC